MSTIERDEVEAARLRRVLNRSAIIAEERQRVRHRLAVATGILGVVAVVGVAVGVSLLPGRSISLTSETAGHERAPTTLAPAGTGAGRAGEAFAWESGVLGASVAGPAFGAGRVFVMAADRSVVAVDPGNGAVLWSHPIVVADRDALGKTAATVDYADGLVFAAGPDVPLQALDAKTGNLRWTTAGTSPTPAMRGVAVLDDLIAVANSTGVAAFDLATGSPRWSAHTAPAQAAAGRGPVIVAVAGSSVIAVDRSTGAVRWTTPLPAVASARPTFESDAVVVVVDDNGGLHRLATADGRIQASVAVATCRPCTLPGQALASQPTVVAGRIIVGTPTGVVAVDAQTSAVVWKHATPAPVTSSPVPAGASSVVVPLADPPALLELDAATGRVLRETPLPAPPAGWALALDRRIVVTTLDGRVRAIAR